MLEKTLSNLNIGVSHGIRDWSLVWSLLRHYDSSGRFTNKPTSETYVIYSKNMKL